ncbi:MAG: hypothetical protein PWP71_2646 [Clostridia bacterium]|jgi:D-3-phosphoglycerate dehydrogenase|nr:hypothetical protein [Clostridia bacterium]
MSKYKVLITAQSFGKEGHEPFEILERANIEPVLKQKEKIWSEDELAEIISDFDGIIIGADKLTKKLIDKASKLKIISKHGVGVDNIDVNAATERGIPVVIAQGSNAVAVAELALALTFDLARNIQQCNLETKKGKWNRIIGVELQGKTAGIIGMGRIGKEVAKRVYYLGMNILAFDLYEDKEFAKNYSIDYVDLNTLLRKSDFVTLHLPLTKETEKIINKNNICLMKPTAYIINTARGGLIDEEALYEALKNNKIAGAAIDTFELEPPVNSSLLSLSNLIATPHIGAYTHEAINNMSRLAAQAVADFFMGKEPYYVINKQALRVKR